MDKLFSSIVGNEPIKEHLLRMIKRERIGNSFLFSGPDGVGKGLFAETFARASLQSDKRHHPDLHIYRPEGKSGMHSIESMRGFTKEVFMEPFEASRKFFIIHDAERMLPTSSNALLKTFEEPSLDSVIILISSSPEQLLPTVKSRCQTLHFHSISDENITQYLVEQHSIPESEAAALAPLANGSLSSAIRLATEKGDSLRKQVLDLLTLGKTNTYQELVDALKQITSEVDRKKEKTEEALRAALSNGQEKEMSAFQKQALEKEVLGTSRMKLHHEAREIFSLILSWYRDLELLSVNGNSSHLQNPDYLKALQDTNTPLTYTYVQDAVCEAIRSHERSTSLQNCLESLFLKLRFV